MEELRQESDFRRSVNSQRIAQLHGMSGRDAWINRHRIQTQGDHGLIQWRHLTPLPSENQRTTASQTSTTTSERSTNTEELALCDVQCPCGTFHHRLPGPATSSTQSFIRMSPYTLSSDNASSAKWCHLSSIRPSEGLSLYQDLAVPAEVVARCTIVPNEVISEITLSIPMPAGTSFIGTRGPISKERIVYETLKSALAYYQECMERSDTTNS